MPMTQLAARNDVTQAVATGTAAASATAFGAQTRMIRVVSNSACHILVGGAPVATVTDPFLPPLWVEYLNVNPGEKISAIQAATNGLVTATAGKLWVSELT
jgi:uncharacterized Zn-binding protein involved in type VI secretion